jgi:hypothetical protein
MIAVFLLLGGCGPHYTIPAEDSDDIGKVISSGRTPQSCSDNLKEEAQEMGLRVKLTDIQHHNPGPVSWVWTNSYTCTGKVVSKAR